MENLTKSILIPLDGSKNSLRSLDYLNLIYGSRHNIDVNLIYILPSLPPILAEKEMMDRKLWAKRRSVVKRNIDMAEQILKEGRNALIDKGFKQESIKALYQEKKATVAQDIYILAKDRQADALLLTRRGEGDVKTFFAGGVSGRLIEYCKDCPVWIVDGGINSKKVLVCMDSSENALRSVDHAGFMLSRTDSKVTLFHATRHLRQFVPTKTLEETEDLEQFWESKEEQKIAPYLKKAKDMLSKSGLADDQIAIKVVDGSRSTANDILKEAQENDYGTIVLGRRGISAVKEFFMGSVTTRVLHHSAGFAVWIVQ